MTWCNGDGKRLFAPIPANVINNNSSLSVVAATVITVIIISANGSSTYPFGNKRLFFSLVSQLLNITRCAGAAFSLCKSHREKSVMSVTMQVTGKESPFLMELS
jgi:hypothetical protein